MKHLPELVLVLLCSAVLYYFAANISLSSELSRVNEDMKVLQEDMRREMRDTTRYYENRTNRLAQTQDEYQSMMDTRVRVLEGRIEGSRTDRSIQINNNNSNVIQSQK